MSSTSRGSLTMVFVCVGCLNECVGSDAHRAGPVRAKSTPACRAWVARRVVQSARRQRIGTCLAGKSAGAAVRANDRRPEVGVRVGHLSFAIRLRTNIALILDA